jgi:hypothetical protein
MTSVAGYGHLDLVVILDADNRQLGIDLRNLLADVDEVDIPVAVEILPEDRSSNSCLRLRLTVSPVDDDGTVAAADLGRLLELLRRLEHHGATIPGWTDRHGTAVRWFRTVGTDDKPPAP